MALNISGYTDPGVYSNEVVVPGSVSLSTVPLTVCLIGAGKRTKRVLNEAVTRGQVVNESLTVGATPGAHTASLLELSTRKSAQTTLYANGTALDSSTWSFQAATVTGVSLTTLNMTTVNKISLSIDGKQAVTIAITAGASDLTTITGSLITQQLASITLISAVTPANIVEAINKALAGATSLGYGATYSSVASLNVDKVVLTSPSTNSTSDVKLFVAFPSAESETAAVFGALSFPYTAPTSILIADSSWTALTVFTIDYVATNSNIDALANTGVQSIIKVGSYANSTSFVLNTDFSLSTDSLDWSISTAAILTGAAGATWDISTLDTIVLSLDGKAAVTVDLRGAGAGVPGYADPAVPTAATPTELVNNINAVLAHSAVYGPVYAGVATVSGTGPNQRIVVTSPITGRGSFVEISAPTTASAVTLLFGLATTQLPYSRSGTGAKPSPGIIYFATYEYTRPSTDYNVVKQFFNPDSLYADIGYPAVTNPLAIGASIAFENDAPSVIVVQVNDSTFPGSPTQSEYLAALTATETKSACTDIVMLTPALNSQVDVLNSVVNMCSPINKNYRRGWFGMARNTATGDRDTADTFIYRAVRTLQVPADSPGRGRLLLTAPTNVTRTITLEDATTVDVDLDGTFLSAAIAGKMSSFTSPSNVLLRKTITGFKTDNFQTYEPAERRLLASNGVNVVTLDAGKLVLLDPVTTEAGNGKLPQFAEPSATPQKDATTLAVNQQVDANLVGVVPDDLGAFVTTVKGFIAAALRAEVANGSIAPYRNSNGTTRDVDLARDIQVYQDATDPTKFSYRYWFNLKYPAKRFFGEYSVDRSFF